MSIIGSGGTRITPAACVPPRYGLLTVAEIEDRDEAAGHWQAGFSQDVASCDDIIVMSNDCAPTPENKEGALGGVDTFDGDPFTLVAGYECSVGGRPVEDAWRFAGDRLTQGEARAVERTFWTGLDNFGNPIRNTLGYAYEEDEGAFDVTPDDTAVPITDGLALLESWAGDNMSCAPVIHAGRGLAVYMANAGLLEPSGQILYSKGTGSRIAIGGGYLVNGPLGVEPAVGEGWMFVTGSIKVVRSPMFFTPEEGEKAAAINRSTNDIQVFAERTYGITRGCGLAAVRVILGSTVAQG